MNTVILGAGALGSIIGAYLHAAGHRVTLVAREPRASLLEREGVRVTGLVDLQARVPVVREVGEAGPADLYINALKTFHNPAVLTGLVPPPHAIALSVQNGVIKDRELAAVFADRVVGAVSLIGGEVLADGASRMTRNEGLVVGEIGGADSERVRALAALLQGSGLPTAVVDDITGAEWAKYAVFVPLFCAALLTRQDTYRVLGHPETAQLVVLLIREMIALAQAEGVTVPAVGELAAATIAALPLAEAVRAVRAHGAQLAQGASRHKVSGLQDLERGRPTEVEETVGHAVRRARALGLDLPHLRTCYALCSAISPLPMLAATQRRLDPALG